MRKFIVLLVMFSSFIVTSQVELKPGVKTGLNLANITHSNFDVKPDFYAGISLGLQFSERYILQPDVLYSRQGARPQLDGVSDSEIQIDYLSVVLVNKYAVFKDVKLYAVAGPFFDFVVDDNLDLGVGYFGFLDKFDIGFIAGLDYEFSSGLGIDLRYKLGFSDIDLNFNDQKQHTNKLFQLGLSYNFKF